MSEPEKNTAKYCYCGRRHETDEQVQSCQLLGIPTPRYLKGEQIQFWGGELMHKATILELQAVRDPDSDYDPHNDPIYYLVEVHDGHRPYCVVSEDDPSRPITEYDVDGIVGKIGQDDLLVKPPQVERVCSFEERNNIFDTVVRAA
ncbi:MAG: hypothetical protein A2534_05155 [Candidatus Magasanikbacteria bacterium RIFOXYD2_FULL_39_9]|uniref:Uncharacterized protein n=1 Tax=Candidatus Magasanikbacteria bacterium RIFOXYD1_FULL_40_23 TaxID=1798705 RepID=A0A1F6P851_9BACT|nr:MAG: hypothetical protein A2534_05155 [Candidatus Magasanikbacteria bacterium RIFOXYD2_FULL_39_9]OGH92143.1 MAG: hypothetical protein A2563_00980 [Candidatus Magasanikbacteria bacterium RIFOXYD1_FULL_40_23]